MTLDEFLDAFAARQRTEPVPWHLQGGLRLRTGPHLLSLSCPLQHLSGIMGTIAHCATALNMDLCDAQMVACAADASDGRFLKHPRRFGIRNRLLKAAGL